MRPKAKSEPVVICFSKTFHHSKHRALSAIVRLYSAQRPAGSQLI